MNEEIKIIDLDKGETSTSKSCVSLGNFDGVHRGHKKLMVKNVEISKAQDLSPACLLFKENTKLRLNEESNYLTSLDDKIEILKDIGIETILTQTFDEDFRSLPAEEFIKEIIREKINAKAIVVGKDYRFGKFAQGNVETLLSFEDQYGYQTYVEEFETDEGVKISSGTIRDLIKEGNISRANFELGRPYKIKGEVIHGKKRGRHLNFPTANLGLDFNYILPVDGVYLTRVAIGDEEFFGLTNIGTNPTFENQERKIETYIMDFSRDIYEQKISLEFLEFFRPDYKFDSAKALIDQMNMDKERGRKVIRDKYL